MKTKIQSSRSSSRIWFDYIFCFGFKHIMYNKWLIVKHRPESQADSHWYSKSIEISTEI